MSELYIGTTNEAKVKQIRAALLSLDLLVQGIDGDLPDIEEDGQTAQDNARKKALEFAQFLGKNVLSTDIALFFEGLSEDQQPGLHVRRIPGKSGRASDDELREYYLKLIKDSGGKLNGHWKYAVCVASPEAVIGETMIVSPRVFVDTASPVQIPGYPLISIQLDPEIGKYLSEMAFEEKDQFWQRSMGQKLRDFVSGLEL